MGFVYEKARTATRVRVTRTVHKDKGGGFGVLVAREGEELSAAEAYRRGVPEDALEGVGPGGALVLAAAGAAQPPEPDGDDQPDGDPEGNDSEEFPRHRGGGNWLLSDGSKFRGSREEADHAEAALAGVVEGEEPPAEDDADDEGSPEDDNPDEDGESSDEQEGDD